MANNQTQSRIEKIAKAIAGIFGDLSDVTPSMSFDYTLPFSMEPTYVLMRQEKDTNNYKSDKPNQD